jgi:5-(carboxyamino)imidazole ribonucleotide mutase
LNENKKKEGHCNPKTLKKKSSESYSYSFFMSNHNSSATNQKEGLLVRFKQFVSLHLCKTEKIMAEVGIIMGSASDLPIMQEAADILNHFGVAYEMNIVSAHRTPELMFDYAKNAHSRGIKVIIAGAGGAAHLPGMTASLTPLPVIGVPVKSSNSIDGWDSILSILQMPNGIPVATVALNAAKNAGILATKIIGATDPMMLTKLQAYMEEMKAKVMESAEKLK